MAKTVNRLTALFPTALLRKGAVALSLMLAGTRALAAPPSYGLPDVSAWRVPTTALADRLKQDRDKFEEFRFIADKARELGIADVWFSGGGAASFAHYEKQKILAEQGKIPFTSGRFIDDILQVQRLSQDFDIVVDGSPDQCEKLQHLLDAKFPYRSGNRSKWEVRPLRVQMGTKIPLLGNPDFLAQNNDSHSVGMVSLYSSKPETERVFRDLRAWESPEPPFLKDVAEHRLHFYVSPLHEQNSAAARRENPPLLSAIRYLIKAFQFNLDISPADFEEIRKIVETFDPGGVGKETKYVQDWLRYNLKKLVSQNSDLARAWNILDAIGLRPKLIQLEKSGFFGHNQDHKFNSQIFAREPFRSATDPNWKPLTPTDLGKIQQTLRANGGRRRHVGRTAAQIGIQRLFHATSSQVAYESLTKASGAFPNAFVSRPDIEDAWYGPGFYAGVESEAKSVAVGKNWGDLIVRLELDPDAVEGTDFLFVEGGDDISRQIVLLNRDKVRIVHDPGMERRFYEKARKPGAAAPGGPTNAASTVLSELQEYWRSYLALVEMAKSILSKSDIRQLEGEEVSVKVSSKSSFDLLVAVKHGPKNAKLMHDRILKDLSLPSQMGKAGTPETVAKATALLAGIQATQPKLVALLNHSGLPTQAAVDGMHTPLKTKAGPQQIDDPYAVMLKAYRKLFLDLQSEARGILGPSLPFYLKQGYIAPALQHSIDPSTLHEKTAIKLLRDHAFALFPDAHKQLDVMIDKVDMGGTEYSLLKTRKEQFERMYKSLKQLGNELMEAADKGHLALLPPDLDGVATAEDPMSTELIEFWNDYLRLAGKTKKAPIPPAEEFHTHSAIKQAASAAVDASRTLLKKLEKELAETTEALFQAEAFDDEGSEQEAIDHYRKAREKIRREIQGAQELHDRIMKREAVLRSSAQAGKLKPVAHHFSGQEGVGDDSSCLSGVAKALGKQ